ncbi:MAG: hypothetical protein H6Q33_9 [Deltaproteobacteria bacterium]|nr:hypothetical protein [Deltaproteobacteria bacterium]
MSDEILSAEFELGFTYTRSPGPVIGKFLAALQQRRLYGIRGSDGRVLFPPTEYDPLTGADLRDYAPVAEEGAVVAWTWVRTPRRHHLLRQPFAWALVKLDGADTPFLHMVVSDSEADIHAGLRVSVRWADERRGAITDIAWFEPVRKEA